MGTTKKAATESPPPRSECVVLSDPGPKPELKWLSVADLYIDKLYQRSMNGDRSRGNIVRMQNEFCWAHCGALIGAFVPAKKKYAVIDGQHRLEAAKRRGDIKEMPCSVITGRDLKRQADSFVVVNTRRVAMHIMAKLSRCLCRR